MTDSLGASEANRAELLAAKRSGRSANTRDLSPVQSAARQLLSGVNRLCE